MDLSDSIPHLRFLIAGRLSRSFTVLPSGDFLEDIPGGSAFYAAAGAAIWERGVGIVGRVGSDYPEDWLRKLDKWNIDRRGVRRLSDPMDLREFNAYPDQENRIKDSPVSHFANNGISFPKALLGYAPHSATIDSHTRPTPATIRQSDFPSDYLDATAAHICPMDFLSHTLLPPTLRQGHINTITLDPGEGYMTPNFWDDMPIILNGLTAFICNEDKLAALFQGRTFDTWEMADELSSLGCDIIVIKRGGRGQLIYERSNHARWIIPAYPSRVRNLSGAGDAFCGGFLAGFRSTYDPLQAALQGNISASLVIEGTDPFFVFDCMPGLPKARLDALREMARRK